MKKSPKKELDEELLYQRSTDSGKKSWKIEGELEASRKVCDCEEKLEKEPESWKRKLEKI